MIKSVILCAGYGTRLGDLTKNKPKPTIVVGGRTVIEQIIDNLHIHGITQIIVNLHYLPTIITERINNRALYFYEPKLLGHEGTLEALKDWLKEDDFFVINGDTISNVQYSFMISNHQPKTISVLMDQWRCAGTWLYSKEYFIDKHLSVIPYRPANLEWQDIGTPERLAKARKMYAKD